MKSIRVLLATIVLLIVLVSSLPALAGSLEFAGEWRGAIDISGQKLEIIVRLSEKENDLGGEMDIPIQGAMGIPLQDVAIEGNSVTFALGGGIPGDPNVVATLDEQGTVLQGTFNQLGASYPLKLEKEGLEDHENQARRSDEEVRADLRAFVDSLIVQWDVPGVAVGVFYKGKVFMAEGFGYRDVSNQLPVTADTLFAIGSSTKAFTAATVALLVDEGKLSWDKPIIDYLPWFRLEDTVATTNATLRDFATHRTGLARHDFAWYGGEFTREQAVYNLRHLESALEFRQQFLYNNFGYTTMAHVVETVTGVRWEDMVRERIFDVLGMDNTNFSILDVKNSKDHSLPYKKQGGQVESIPFRSLPGMEPAGAINSNVQDMLKWVQLFLGGGRLGDKQILSPNSVYDMTRPQIALPVAGYPEVRFGNYGLGWMIDDYRGDVMVHHGGNIDGFSALVAMFPQRQLGIVVLSNMNNTPVPTILTYRIADELLGHQVVDWSGRLQQTYSFMPEEMVQPPKKVEGTVPSRSLEQFVGHYEHPAYGRVVITKDGDGLRFIYRGEQEKIEHWHYDVFVTRLSGFAVNMSLPIHFVSGIDGHIKAIEIPFDPTVKPIRFEAVADLRMFDPDLLSRFQGVYEVLGTRLAVRLRGEVLILDFGAQGSAELSPERGTRFSIKEMEGGAVEFIEKDGEVVGLYLTQPNGTFEAKLISK